MLTPLQQYNFTTGHGTTGLLVRWGEHQPSCCDLKPKWEGHRHLQFARCPTWVGAWGARQMGSYVNWVATAFLAPTSVLPPTKTMPIYPMPWAFVLHPGATQTSGLMAAFQRAIRQIEIWEHDYQIGEGFGVLEHASICATDAFHVSKASSTARFFLECAHSTRGCGDQRSMAQQSISFQAIHGMPV